MESERETPPRIEIKEEAAASAAAARPAEDNAGVVVSTSAAGADDFAISTKNIESLKEEMRQTVKVEDDATMPEAPPKSTPATTKAAEEAGDKTDAVQEVKKLSEKLSTEPSTPTFKQREGAARAAAGTPGSSSKHHRGHHRDPHHRHRKQASIGVQCRRDKNLAKHVGFGEGAAAAALAATSPKYGGFSLANPMPSLAGSSRYKYGALMRVETYPNGGAKVLHMWQDEISAVSAALAKGCGEAREKIESEVAAEFLREAFSEVGGWARYCCSIVHGAAAYLPDFLEYLGTEHNALPVKHGVIGHPRDMETCTLGEFRERVSENYKNGTFRFGFLDNLSLVGTVSEETGGFLPDILDMLEESPFLRLVRIATSHTCSSSSCWAKQESRQRK